MGKKPVVWLTGLFWVGVTLAGCESTGRPVASNGGYGPRPTWPGQTTARNTTQQQSPGWNATPRNTGGNTVATSDGSVTPDTSGAAQPGMRTASDVNATPGSGTGVPSPSGLQQTNAAFPSGAM